MGGTIWYLPGSSPGARSTAAERSAHNRLVTGSNPVEPTFEATFPQKATDSFQKSHVLPELTESLQLRELLYILLGNKGRRHLELRQKPNGELFALYEGELTFHHRSARGIHEAKRILNHFHNYLGEFPPTPELAKSFLKIWVIKNNKIYKIWFWSWDLINKNVKNLRNIKKVK